MEKDNRRNNERPTYASLTGQSIGGLVGTGIGALLGPEFALILGASGGWAGGTLGYALTKNPNWKSHILGDLTVEKLIAAKTIKDFNFSVIDELSSMTKAYESSQKRIDLLSEVKKRNFMNMTSQSSFKWLNKNLNSIKKNLKNESIPYEIKKIADEINEFTIRDGKIQFSCAAIHPGAVSVIMSLKNHSRLGVNINLEYTGTSGVYQLGSLAQEKNKFDFVITANAPFFLHGDKFSEIKKNYRHCFELHGQEQVVLRKRTLRKKKSKRVHVFSDSSAEEQFLIKNRVYENTELFSHKYYEELTKVVSNLDADELIIAWEPLATYLSRDLFIKRNEDVFYNWVSLFQNKKWGNRHLKKLGDKFKTLLIYEWLYLMDNRERSIEFLLSDYEFIERFKLGSGINVPTAFK